MYFPNNANYRTVSLKSQEEMFMMMASDAGLGRAHCEAAKYYLYQKDYGKFEDKLLTILHSPDGIDFGNAYDVVQLINEYLTFENELTAGMIRMLDEIDRSGNSVFLLENGRYWVEFAEVDDKTHERKYRPVEGGIPWSEISSSKDK